MFWALLVGSALADPYALTLERSQAALWAGQPDRAVVLAQEALDQAPHAFRAHRAWQRGMLALGLEEEATAHYRALASAGLPQARWLGGWWIAWREGVALEEVQGLPRRMEAIWSAELLWLRGDSRAAVEMLEGVEGPDAARIRMKALGALREHRLLGREAREMMSRYPEHPDLYAALWAGDARVLRRSRHQASQMAQVAMTGDLEGRYRAYALFVRAGERDLAEEAALALLEAGEPWALGSHLPFNEAMIRDLGRVLARKASPEVPAGCTAIEEERIWMSIARRHAQDGRGERAADMYRRAAAVGAVRADLWLEIATFLEEAQANPAEVLALLEAGREQMAPIPYPASELHRERLARLWSVEAQAARRAGLDLRSDQALEEAQALRTALALSPPVPESAERRSPGVGPLLLKTTLGHVKVGQGGESLVVLTIWASWCGPCREELPELARLSGRLAEEGLAVSVVGVSIDSQKSDYERWVRRNRMPGLALTWFPEIQRSLRVDGIPVTFVLDGDGVIRERRQGYQPGDMDRLETRIRALLE